MPDAPRTIRRAPKLTRWQRVLAGAVGIATLVLAGAALIVGIDGAATVAFVAFSGIALFFAVTGIIPARLAIGDKIIDLATEEIIGSIDQTAPELPSEVLRRVAHQAIRTAGDTTPLREAAARRLAEHVLFEDQVMAVVRNAAQTLGAEVIFDGGNESQWDARLTLDGRTAFVEARLTLDAGLSRAIRQRALSTAASGCVIVVVRDTTEDAVTNLAIPNALALIRWDGDPEPIFQAIRGALAE